MSTMWSCARRLAVEKYCTDSTRAFLRNAQLQFAACCEARDWQMLAALVDIHGLLRFSVSGAGFDGEAQGNNDLEKARACCCKERT